MNKTKDQLIDLLDGRQDLIPQIHDALAEHHISDASYADVFRILYCTIDRDPGQELSYSPAAKEWQMGKRVMSDVRLFGLLAKVCDVIHLYVRASWEECIFSAWLDDTEIVKAEREMQTMESLSHARAILNAAANAVSYTNDGKMDWGNLEDEMEAL